MTPRKKLIEVALPLEAINAASAREKSIRHGHPSTLHLWWARRPLAAARAVIFASLVDDPDDPAALPAFVEACRRLPKGPNAAANDTPRMRLFDFIEALVQWESTTDEQIMGKARELIRIATGGNPPPLLDPFAGGGSIPLEAQRLGLEAHASDLNPVAVMINKAQIEIPPRFANRPPVNPTDRRQMFGGKGGGHTWRGAAGLAADVRYYGEWMRERAFKRIGHLYPTCNGETVIAWLWARTVKSPNPAVHAQAPLVRSFELSKKKGKRVWVEPVVETLTGGGTGTMQRAPAEPTHRVGFVVRREQDGDDPRTAPEGTVNRKGGRDLISGVPMPFDYIRAEGKAGRMGAALMAIVTEGKGGRNYYSPDELHVQVAQQAQPEWKPDHVLPVNPRDFKTPNYGMRTFADLFTPRQLVALTTFSDLVAEARAQAEQDAKAAGLPDDGVPLRDGGTGARAYAEAVSVYLVMANSRVAMGCNTLARWNGVGQKVQHCFGRQALPMVWDFADPNPFTESTGSWASGIKYVADPLSMHGIEPLRAGTAQQKDAAAQQSLQGLILSTDPPYYDNVGYADLSDFFYVWMRPPARSIYPDIFGTVLVPKTPELVATPYRFGGDRDAANAHFENGMLHTFTHMRGFTHADYPLTVYYAFKQQETDEDDGYNEDDEAEGDVAVASTGWETMLGALIQAGFSIDGTWPIRTEMRTRLVAAGTNALASSIVLVCRPRPDDAPVLTRRQFLDGLRAELPPALRALQSGSIAPVDLAQASIGPGMAVYSRARQVIEADGSPMTVRAALGLINAALDAHLAEQEGDLDADTRFAVAWFETVGFAEGEFGRADVLARAKNTSVEGVAESGVVQSQRGKVRLIHWRDYDPGAWDPAADKRPTVWEAVHHLIERLTTNGEEAAALLRAKLSDETASAVKELAYRLYSICERKGWAEHARDYNALVLSLTAISDRAVELQQRRAADNRTEQGRLFE